MKHSLLTLTLVLLNAGAPAVGAAEPPITALAFTADGRTLLLGSQQGIELREWPDLTPAGPLPSGLAHVHDLAFSPSGTQLAAVGGRPAESGELEIFSWPERKRLQHGQLGQDVLYRVAWRGDGGQLALAGGDRSLLLVDPTGQLEKSLVGHSRDVLAAAYLQGDEFLVSAGLDNSVRVWRLPDGTLKQTFNNHTKAVRAVAVRPRDPANRQTIATASADRTVRLWWPLVGRMVRFARLPSEPLDMVWTPDGRLIVAACLDGHVRVIDPDTVEIVRDVAALDEWAYSVAVDGRGGSIAVGGRGGVQKLDAPP